MVQKGFSKKTMSVFLTLMFVVFGTIVLKMSVFANEKTKIADECISVSPVQMEISEYRTEKVTINGMTYYTKTPEQADMIFAGWFQDKECKNPVPETALSGTYWAKFVPKHILTVKGQVSSEFYTKKDEETKYRDLRVITTVDSPWYNKVGFQMEIGGRSKHIFSNTVYAQIRAVGDKEGEYIDYTPSGEFCALSAYFKTLTVTGIPESAWGTTIGATPFWVTMDGTIVYGEKGEKSVNQGLSGEPDLNPYVAQIGDEYYQTLQEAVRAVKISDEKTEIILLKDIEIDSQIAWSTNKNIVLTNKEGTKVTISRTADYTGNMFRTGVGSLTIKGADGDGKTGIVIDGKNISLDKDGNASGVAQLIASSTNLIIQNVTMKDAYGTAGGAIRMNGGNLTIENCAFTNIHSTNIGGAILLDVTSNSNISNTTFESNASTTAKSGGAIYVKGSGSHEITDCTFNENTSTDEGGAIYVAETASLTVSKTEFTGNTALKNGGAISDYSTGNVSVTDCRFVENAASKVTGTAPGQGGAIYCAGGEKNTEIMYAVEIKNCDFKSNEAYNHGGALRAGGFYGVYTVENCNFINNTAGVAEKANGVGGAVYATQGAKVSVLADEAGVYVFDGNVAYRGTENYLWGAIANSSSQTLIYSNNYTYTNNTDGVADQTGVGVGAYGPDKERTVIKVDVTASSYSELKEKIGEATTTTATQITLLNSMEGDSEIALSAGQHIILTNKAGNSVTIQRGSEKKGILFNVTTGSLTVEGTEENGKTGIVMDGNSVRGSQMCYVIGSELTLKNVTIQNAFGTAGAAVRADAGSNLTIDNCQIIGSNGNNIGGAILLDGNKGDVTSAISNSLFEKNSSTKDGGAIYIRGTGTHQIKNCDFKGNQTNMNGGALYVAGSAEVSVLADEAEHVFTNNTAKTGTSGYIWGAIANGSSKALQYSTLYEYTGNTNGTTDALGTGVGPTAEAYSVTPVDNSEE